MGQLSSLSTGDTNGGIKIMQHHAKIVLAIAAAGLFNLQAARADTPEEKCGAKPYIGVCQQGCDEDRPSTALGTPAPPAANALNLAQAACSSTPYLNPLCPDEE